MYGSMNNGQVTKPLVSVCMITYNHEAYIGRAIEGVMTQDLPYPFELVIGEDHSSDRTREICLEAARNHSGRIRVLESNANLGITANFSRTLGECRGMYIAICEGDDFWTETWKLSRQVKFLEDHPEFAMIAGRVSLVDQNGQKPEDIGILEDQLCRMKREPHFTDLLEYNMINTPTVCIRSDMLRNLVNEAVRRRVWYGVDYWYWLRIAATQRIYISDEVTAAYRIHSEGASRQGHFLRRRMPWIRYDAVSHFAAESLEITVREKSDLFTVMMRIIRGKDSSLKLRLQSLLWCAAKPSFFMAWLHGRNKKSHEC